MPRTKAEPPLLDAAQAAFLAGPVAINVASHDGARVPSVARAFGCRVSDDLREVVVFLSQKRSRSILDDLAAGAPIAAVIRRLAEGDREIMLACGAAFCAEIMALGYSESFSHALMAPTADEGIGIAFTPVAVFEQTPGPKAGMRLEPKP
jgi:hypothetical protein